MSKNRFYLSFLITFILFMNLSIANANVYIDEFNLTKELYSAEKYDASILKLNDLIQSGNLDEETLTKAFLYRGLSNYQLNNYISAITDITNSLWLDLLTSNERQVALETRSLARSKIGQVDLANQDQSYLNSLDKTKDVSNTEETSRVNIEDLSVESKIDNIKNNFSMNISNFFGTPDIEIAEKEKSNEYVINDQDIYKEILNFDEKENPTSDLVLIDDSLDIEKIEEIQEPDISEIKERNNSESNDVVETIVSDQLPIIEQATLSYIELATNLNEAEATVKINRIINDNYKVLSGIKPESRKSSANGAITTYDIILGPFSNMSRLQDIAKSLEQNNYQYKIKKL
jgi:hypothetical protein